MIYIAMLVALAVRPSAGAFVFVACAAAHFVAGPMFNDQGYYLSAAFIDLFVISFIASLDTLGTKNLQLQILSAVSLVCNFGGWALWLAYIESTYYNAAFMAIYLAAIAVILQGGPARHGHHPRTYSLLRRLRRFAGAVRVVRRKHGTTL